MSIKVEDYFAPETFQRMKAFADKQETPFVVIDKQTIADAYDQLTHCFPFAGCVAYLGYFDHDHAERAAAALQAQGYDTAVRGVAAYSTLGWFADPIVSSMLRGGQDELDRVIFHELAHQKLYVPGDTAFNESYASFVAEQGLREWRVANGRPTGTRDASHEDGFTRLVPSVVTIAAMIGSVVLLALAMRTLPLGTAYTVWTGIGAVGAFLVGIMVLGEGAGALRLAAATLIVAGLVLMKVASPE